jgi:hypothetical protein
VNSFFAEAGQIIDQDVALRLEAADRLAPAARESIRASLGRLTWVPKSASVYKSSSSHWSVTRKTNLFIIPTIPPFSSAAICANWSSFQFYLNDMNCPLAYEPSGEDFLSPCLGEADMMRRVLPPSEFATWLFTLLPQYKVSTRFR